MSERDRETADRKRQGQIETEITLTSKYMHTVVSDKGRCNLYKRIKPNKYAIVIGLQIWTFITIMLS